MFADSLLVAEQLSFLRLMIWGSANVIAAAVTLALVGTIWRNSELLRVFGAACGALGGLELVGGWVGYRTAVLRDYGAAVRLDRLLWLDLGTCIGALALGITLAIMGWRLSRRLPLVGVGVAIVTHAAAVALIDLRLVAILSR